MNTWIITGNRLVERDDKVHRITFRVHVLAVSIEDAIDRVNVEYPDAVIYSASHQGEIALVSDAAVEVVIGAR